MGRNYLSTPELQIWEWVSNFIPHFAMDAIIIHAWIKDGELKTIIQDDLL